MAEAGTNTVNIMRKRIFNFAVLAAAAGILAACSSYEEIPAVADLLKAETQAVDSITVTFTATLEQPEDTTRTSLDVSNWRVKWSNGDKVTVIGKGTYSSWGQKTAFFQVPGTVSNISDDGYTATISADLPSQTTNQKAITYTEYYAVYPAITASSQSDNLTISASLKSEQPATAGTFADNVNISAAKSNNKNEFHFQNLCALLSFTVDTDIVSATLTSNSQTPMSGGTATISFSDDTPSISMPVTGSTSSSVKLTGNIEQGTQYYFVVYPGEHENGFTLEFEDNDGRYASMTSTKSLPLAAKDNVFLGDIKVPADRWTKLNKISAVGVYNTNCEVEYEYKPYNDQLVWSVTPSVNGFRIQKMDSRKFINIAGLPGTFTDGDTFTLSVNENLLTDQGSEFTDKVKVFSTDNGIVRLKGEKHNYIIQTK